LPDVRASVAIKPNITHAKQANKPNSHANGQKKSSNATQICTLSDLTRFD
jgi:hypothetical protein